VRVRPSARCSSIAGYDGQAIRADVAAPAIAGRANQELIHTLAEALGISKSLIRIVSGQTARTKLVEIELAPSVVAAWLSTIPLRTTEVR
jgi:uncharacterized protein